MWVFFEGKHKILLSQWLTFKLFGEYISYLVGNTKFKVLYQDTCGWVRNIYIYRYIHVWLYDIYQYLICWSNETSNGAFPVLAKGGKVSAELQASRYLLSCGLFLCVFFSFVPTSISTESILPTSKKHMLLGPFGPWQLNDHFHRLPVESCWCLFHHRMCVCVCVPISICINEFSPCSTRGKNAEANCCLF